MYLESYRELISWLSQVRAGQQLYSMLESLIPVGKEKGFLFSGKNEDAPLKYLVFDDKIIIDGILDIYRDNVVLEFNVRLKKAIVQNSCQMISHPNVHPFNFYDFKNIIFTIGFKNGSELKLCKADFTAYSKNYQMIIKALLASIDN